MPKKCYNCRTENSDDAIFCRECGTPFEIICPQCKKNHNATTKICEECGTPLKKKTKNSKPYIAIIIGGVIIIFVILIPIIRCWLSRCGFGVVDANIMYDSTLNRLQYDSPMLDYDGNSYKTVVIENRTWMAENMRTEHDKDGNSIDIIAKWPCPFPFGYTKDKPYCSFPNLDSSNVKKYGYLYSWEAAKNICPEGWHLPALSEFPGWKMNHHGGASRWAKSLASSSDWESVEITEMRGRVFNGSYYDVGCNLDANNTTGFNALPAGTITMNYSEWFGSNAFFWVGDENEHGTVRLRYDASEAVYVKYDGLMDDRFFSVRCVRDESARW